MTESTHNALAGNSADQLRGYIHRIERLDVEITELNGDKREVYAEVKACGFDKKIMRQLIARRRLDAGELEEADALLELYEQVLKTGTTVDPLD